MITDKLFEWFAAAIRWVLGVLPDWQFPDLAADVESLFVVIGPHGSFAAWFNLYVPLTEALALLGIGLVIWVAAHAYFALVWVLTKLHVMGGSSDG